MLIIQLLNNICKSYTSTHNFVKTKNIILRDISLECELGEIICIVGANGSGKSTLINIICGIIAPDSGKVIPPSSIGFVPQENGLFEELSIKENIDFWSKAFCKKSDYSSFNKEDLKKKVNQLSGGTKKRLSIIISLINEPDFLIMDEPTASLDLIHQQIVMDIILAQKLKNRCVIFTTHICDEIKKSDKLFIIKNGSFVYNGLTGDFSNTGDFQGKLHNIITLS